MCPALLTTKPARSKQTLQCSLLYFSALTPAVYSEEEVVPELTCPPSASVILTDYSVAVTLTGADTKDKGKTLLEYIPQLLDNSATYQLPNKLIFTQSSTGSNYSVLVKARDTNGNEAKCHYSIMVKGKTQQCRSFMFVVQNKVPIVPI